MSSFLNKQSKFLLGISPFPPHPNPCKLRFSFFHLNVSIAWIIFMSLCFIIKDISHSGLPLHLASDVFALRGHKTHPPRPPLASCLLLQLGTSWAWPSLLPFLFLCPFLSPWTCQRFVQGEAADFTVGAQQITLTCFRAACPWRSASRARPHTPHDLWASLFSFVSGWSCPGKAQGPFQPLSLAREEASNCQHRQELFLKLPPSTADTLPPLVSPHLPSSIW